MRASQLRVVIVVMIMRALPDTHRAQDEYPKNIHDETRKARPGKDRIVLLIMINDKEPQDQQSSENTANDLPEQVDVPKSACQRRC